LLFHHQILRQFLDSAGRRVEQELLELLRSLCLEGASGACAAASGASRAADAGALELLEDWQQMKLLELVLQGIQTKALSHPRDYKAEPF